MKYKYTFLKNRLFYDEILIPYLDRMSKKGWNLVSVNSFFIIFCFSDIFLPTFLLFFFPQSLVLTPLHPDRSSDAVCQECRK